MLAHSQGAALFMLRLVLLSAVACVRFAHFERSGINDWGGELIIGACKKGKARVRGARPGYGWAVPRVVNDIDVFGPLQSTLSELPETTGLFPDVLLATNTLSQSSAITSSPLPSRKFVVILRTLAIAAGCALA